MKLSEEMRNFSGMCFPYREYADKVEQLEAEIEALKCALFRSHCLQGGLEYNEIEIDYDSETAVPVEALLKGEKPTPVDTPISDIPASP